MLLDKKIILLYLLLLLFHFAHVLEEVWGHFIILSAVLGEGRFMAVNCALFAIPVVFFYFLLVGKRWAYWCGMGYALVMALNGLAHNLGWLFTGRYFGFAAGAVSGWGLMTVGGALVVVMWRERI
jgi:hypothetical protein